MSDESYFVERLKRGELEAQRRFIDDHYEAVLRLVLSLVRDEDAHDLVQDVFVVAQRRIGSFRGESALKTWLFGIAFGEVRNWRRKKWRGVLLGDDAVDLGVKSVDPWRMATAGMAMREAIQRLSAEQGGALVMHEVSGMTVGEIAEAQGVPEGTVMSRLYHARKKVREFLGDWNGGEVGATGRQEA